MRRFVFGLVLVLAASTAASDRSTAEERPTFDAAEVQSILAHGPWPMPWSPDPSNRVSGNRAAAALGRQLFFDARLSRFGAISCAFCHKPEKAWGDGRVQASSVARLNRNTTALYNVRHVSWFGWDGASDSLWMHSVRPLTDPRELAATPEHVQSVLSGDAKLTAGYAKVFGTRVARDEPEAVLVNAAKAMAAFQATIVTGPTPFDRYRDALAKGDTRAMARYPAAAERGLKVFAGKGRCNSCHAGPLFSDGQFYDTGVRQLSGQTTADPGRKGGLVRWRESRFTREGPYSDARAGSSPIALPEGEQHAGAAFKVPSLRNVALTAPYMHNGSRATLADAVRHYSELDEDRLHAHSERILRRLDFTPQEIGDLVAFLESLTDTKRAQGVNRNR